MTKKEKKILGILSMGYYLENCDEEIQKVGVISLIFVLKPFRMAGIGKGLINFSKKIFRKWKVKKIELKVGLKNLAGIEFYKKLGFKIRKICLATIEI
ncbi:MAG: GNAT family N-acetyltransferase [candidate division WOR-3 bacterium]|nr:GNAT family N-acetyltransferase [candidate division WOR-3 bacterium]